MRNKLRHLWGQRRQVVVHWLIATLLLLLLAGVLAGASWAPVTYLSTHHYDPYFKAWVDNQVDLSYNELMNLAERLDRVWDDIERRDPDWAPSLTGVGLRWWTAEVAPNYQYEDASRILVYPVGLLLRAPNGMAHNHIAGQSNCFDAYLLNLRFANPLSVWRERSSWLAVAAHEIAHNHQGPLLCALADRDDLENAAQLTSFEVLAGMANKGNKLALFALVEELRGVMLNAAEARALRAGGRIFADYERRLDKVTGGDPIKLANYEKAKRFWAKDMDTLTWILTTYSEEPAQLLAQGLATGHIDGLAINVRPRRLEVDDLAYVLENLEELVAAHLAEN